MDTINRRTMMGSAIAGVAATTMFGKATAHEATGKSLIKQS